MLLKRHKNIVLVTLTAVGVALTVAMIAIGTTITFFGENSTITSNRFSTYGLINAKTLTNPSSNGLKSEDIAFEFEKTEKGKSRSIEDNGFVSLGYALKDANEEEASIFNVHGVSEDKSNGLEFLFESLSPTDYTSKVFYQAHTPFTRLANSAGFSDVKFLSTVGENGSRHVVMETVASNAKISGKDAGALWNQMLMVLSPMSENTSYDLTLTVNEELTVHGTLSTEAEQKKMMEYDAAGNWESAFSLKDYSGVVSTDFYLQGNNKSDNTVALTVTNTVPVADSVKNLTGFIANKENKFPRGFTTTVTVEDEATPAHVFYAER